MGNRTVITEPRSIHKRLTEYKRVKPDENLQSEPVYTPLVEFGCLVARQLALSDILFSSAYVVVGSNLALIRTQILRARRAANLANSQLL